MKLLIPALAAGLVSLYFFSKHRKVELDVEMKMEPREDHDRVIATATQGYEDEH